MLAAFDQHGVLPPGGERIKAYFLSVICGPILCGIVTGLLEKKGAPGKVLKLICGAFLTFTVIRPVTEVRLDTISFFTEEIKSNAAIASDWGKDHNRDAMASIIKLETEAYILDKASASENDLAVEIVLDERLVPCGVMITGDISNAQKAELERIMEEDLGISKEEQIWKAS